MTRSTFDVAVERSDALWGRIQKNPEGLRVLTGDRPTGPLHLGHYFGTLANRVRLQRAGVDVFLVIADYQVITDREDVSSIKQNVRELMLDYLAAGIDEKTATIFTHSAVPALNQLMLPFLSLMSAAELRRNPTVKAESEAVGGSLSGLLLTYPVHQAADILFCGGNVVPVGRDQLPHLETTRLIAHRFNERYGKVFAEPDALLSETPLLLGTDGGKMSKSAHNSIALGASEDETTALIRRAKTDSERVITYDPESRPEVSNLLLVAALCQGRDPAEIAEEIGDAGSGALKKLVTESVNEFLRPMRSRRADLAKNPDYLWSVLRAGNERANAIADTTLDDVRRHMGMSY
ncbi:tryptophan--tRNA ligase [Spelaeicoccus albus]|uniref:Tryptophan--tRNA ligase n=1 Tax=Spelaeicoccus albus TaxID=1280376 RepID=A0A7Z0D375_9MICO|nr:tryptophan--tRNA ligase [Spelaeicoccus albus]NYI68011.1 tryptophanyl-tRNA synthetase [Spelaeicoccus albus]